jgi:hypothetical protein
MKVIWMCQAYYVHSVTLITSTDRRRPVELCIENRVLTIEDTCVHDAIPTLWA